jgi:hypothetical protein
VTAAFVLYAEHCGGRRPGNWVRNVQGADDTLVLWITAAAVDMPLYLAERPQISDMVRSAHQVALWGGERREREMRDEDVQAALQAHWLASDAQDLAGEHEIYEDYAVLEYPQSGERIHGRQRIQESRTAQLHQKRFTVRRLVGSCGLWVSEIVVTSDEQTVWVVSIMEFEGKKVVRETQYFGSPFNPDPSCARWVERMN